MGLVVGSYGGAEVMSEFFLAFDGVVGIGDLLFGGLGGGGAVGGVGYLGDGVYGLVFDEGLY